ncbi:hypothetical protein AB5N19_04077 [Seiridium cardinale]
MSTTSASRPITMTDQVPPIQYQYQPPGIAPTPSFQGPSLDPRLVNQLPQPTAVSNTGYGLKTSRTATEYSLREYMALQKRRRYDDPVAETRLQIQRDLALADLKTLRGHVAALVKAGESHRWGRWVLGGFFATLIPAVRRIFRRPADDEETSNDTEYAFQRSKGLISRTWTLVRNNGALASMGLFVLSVLYVFQAEVSLRVARTVSKRLKRLIQRIEIGNETLDERDMGLFKGWRWRVLNWKS